MNRQPLLWATALLFSAFALAVAGCGKKNPGNEASKNKEHYAKYRQCLGDVHRMSREINRINREGAACARALHKEKQQSALLMTRARQLLETATRMADIQARSPDPAVRKAAKKIKAELQRKDNAFRERLKKL